MENDMQTKYYPVRRRQAIMESGPGGGYYTVDGYPLRDGLRATIGERG
jgi:hypothetical protein